MIRLISFWITDTCSKALSTPSIHSSIYPYTYIWIFSIKCCTEWHRHANNNHVRLIFFFVSPFCFGSYQSLFQICFCVPCIQCVPLIGAMDVMCWVNMFLCVNGPLYDHILLAFNVYTRIWCIVIGNTSGTHMVIEALQICP